MSTIEAPVATITSIILYLIISVYTCMHPPALVLPARVRMFVHFLSVSILVRMSAALAVSREVKDMSRIESMIGVESNEVISICLTGFFRRSFLLLFIWSLLNILIFEKGSL